MASSMESESDFCHKGTSITSRLVQSGRVAASARAVTAAFKCGEGGGERPRMRLMRG